MSLKKIAETNFIDYDLLLQNDRLGLGARLNLHEPYVKPMTKTDNDLIQEYKDQFQRGYENDDGNKYLYDTIEPPELEGFIPEDLHFESDIQYNRELQKCKENQINLDRLLVNVDNEIKRVVEEINNGRMSYKELKRLEKGRDRIVNEIPRVQERINNLELLWGEDMQIRNENEANKNRIDKANKEKLEKYNAEMSVINSGKFNLEQQPNEDNEHFLQRLKGNAEVEIPDANLENAKFQTMIKFKDKMKDILRSEWKIESVISRIDRFGYVDNRLFLLKRWELFKTSFIKLFGVNNPDLSVSDIVAFINSFISKNGDVDETLKEFKKEEKTYTSFESDELLSLEGFKDLKKVDEMRRYLNVMSIDFPKHYRKEDLVKFYQEHLEDTTPRNTPHKKVNKSPSKSGTGIIHENIPEHAHFGNVIILLRKLYFKNILAVKYPSLLSISTFKNVKVSEKFVHIIMNMMEKHYPSSHELSLLSSTEKQIFDRLLMIGGINKHLTHNTSDKSISQLKHRLKLIESEIEAGNDNHELKKELNVILHSLKDFGVIEHKQVKQYLQQLN